MRKLYQLDTRWGCGGVITTCEGIIMEAPPIFKKFIGKDINWLGSTYKVEFVETVDDESNSATDFFD
jgi:hypothetical protein